MNYDRTCNTCRYHDASGICKCPKSEEFRDSTESAYCCEQYERDWRKAMAEAFMKGARR